MNDPSDADKPTTVQKPSKKKKEIRLRNIDIPLNFRPPILPDTVLLPDELQINRVLDYSENDFPQLGYSRKSNTKNRKPKNHNLRSENEVDDSSKSHSEDNLRNGRKPLKKILKSAKHKEAFQIHFEEILSNSLIKPPPKRRIRQVKHFEKDISLGGNPLDSDNPTRLKGVTNAKQKIKRISRTKAMVFKARDEIQRLKQAAEHISIEDNEVLVDENTSISIDQLWKPLCLLKAKDIKKCIRSQIQSEEKNEIDDLDREELPEFSNNSNREKVDDLLRKTQTDDGQSCDQNVRNISAFPLEEVLKDSEIPPYKILIHNNNFKRYCDNCITSELNDITEKLISQLVRYQYKKYQIDPLKAAANKRYVLGLRQVKKYTKMNKTKLIIFVPNMEESLYETVEELKSLAVPYCIPYLFALSRKKLGKLAYKKIGVGCLGILDYSGAEENFNKCIEALTVAKKIYDEKCASAKTDYEQHLGTTIITDDNDHQAGQDVDEEICTDCISKLSLSDENNELDEDNQIVR
ncbi:selenocysteine insertion sequence-binding protein 2 [Planococcus citri]|uniref:selenocysteine insertion sequence-binding protein 2 n=1 Tax=Planococcus citri TaxID=170843 RepID=UPI0031F984D8